MTCNYRKDIHSSNKLFRLLNLHMFDKTQLFWRWSNCFKSKLVSDGWYELDRKRLCEHKTITMPLLGYEKALVEVWSRGRQPLPHQVQEKPDRRQAYLIGVTLMQLMSVTMAKNFSISDFSQLSAFVVSLFSVLRAFECFWSFSVTHCTVHAANTSVEFEVIEDTVQYHESYAQKVLHAVLRIWTNYRKCAQYCVSLFGSKCPANRICVWSQDVHNEL